MWTKTLILLFVVFQIGLAQTALPHGLTAKEKQLMPTYQPPVVEEAYQTPPPNPVRTMAEWEELSGLMITWADYYHILKEIVRYAQEECRIYIVCSDSNQVKAYLMQNNIPINNIKFLIEDFNSIWCRDYGPFSIYEQGTDSLFFTDWIYNRPRPDDDVLPAALADAYNVPLYQMTEPPYDLVATGGNFMTDGLGTGFSSKLILEENSDKTEAEIDDIMNQFMGIDRYIKFETLPYDDIHHIDMHMKLLDEETILVGQYPEGVADGPQIEANLQYLLDNYQTCYGRDYQVVRIPMPPDKYGKYPDEGGAYRTYTNGVFVNKTVIIPTYEEKYDTTAFRIYREALPGYRIVGIPCDDIINLDGAIHCITHELGARHPVFIAHAKIRSATETEASYQVAAVIRTSAGIDSALTYWTTDTTAGFNALKMTYTNNDSFVAQIPAQPAGSEVFYYITAFASNGKIISKPLVGEKGAWKFTVESASQIAWTDLALPANFTIQSIYPNPFNEQAICKFTLKRPDKIDFILYSIDGSKIKELGTRIFNAGQHRFKISGQNLSSGVYFLRIKSSERSFYEKIVLLK
ncbi:MAG: agmatine deiminase family protein [Caldisericaceae bacterium]|nr:agmatine deiminase family protein [Caldisericaceae bacterium]